MKKYKCTALLPMKAHSERIKGKNFKLFKGKPLFEWTLENLITLEAIDLVIINTDSVELLNRKYEILNHPKVLLRERRDEIRGDFVSMNKVLSDDIEAVDSEFYLMTHTTNPLIKESTFNNAIDTFIRLQREGKYDSLFSVNRFQSRFFNSKLEPLNHDPNVLIRTQDLPVLYEENSCLYIFSKESFLTTGSRIGERPFLYETPRLESVDIDDQDTWVLAESIMNFTN
ncbi:acylneuraminate cytidylyltransferase family protein [Roseivirga sp. UBA838]|uniref:acylneuraminate cytidylyltransferase family protein n=1 Tax=Roseivirga sp. UBA838 TaxID=1947393 RepID=UPI00257DBCE6|nr:acylneuraminate cytidylyltransferase family protein [Roseivirga sp. UBA838]|tara:strand:+ start:55234 stop:55917 length:684 start_codon:yes stop_codon:yes gene_type:complete